MTPASQSWQELLPNLQVESYQGDHYSLLKLPVVKQLAASGWPKTVMEPSSEGGPTEAEP